jgi:tetratricopeptide (TPR) repeat protein
MRILVFSLICICAILPAFAASPLETARDAEDRPALQKIVQTYEEAAAKAPKNAEAQYRVALASSYLAEVSLELKDKGEAARAADVGIQAADAAIAIDPNKAEYHRVLATLCGQYIPSNVLRGLSYGRRAKDAIARAMQLDPKSAEVYIAEGVGNYYMPPAFGGGPEPAIQDLHKALEIDPKSAEAYLWMGMALKKEHKNAEAREALAKSLALDPHRIWTKQQLEKTPPQ